MSNQPKTPNREACGCPTNQAGDTRCHRCGQYVNKRCWNCGTPRVEGPCPNPVELFVTSP